MKKRTFVGLYLALAMSFGAAACGKSNTAANNPAPGPGVAPMPIPVPVGPAPIPVPVPVPGAQCVGPSFDAGVYWVGNSGTNQYITYRYVFTAPQTMATPGRVIRVTQSGYQSNYPTQYANTPINSGYYGLWNSGYGALPAQWMQASGPEQISIRISPTAAPGAAALPTVLVLNQANQGVGQAVLPSAGYLVIDYAVPAAYGAQIFYGLNFMLCQ